MKLKWKKIYAAGFIVIMLFAASLIILNKNKTDGDINGDEKIAAGEKHSGETNDDHEKDDHKKEMEKGGHDEHDEEDTVKIEEEELREFGIEISKAGPGNLHKYVNLTGEIVIIPDRLAHIAPRFPGVVKSVRKKIGDRVYRNEVLAVIESNESLVTYNLVSLISGTIINMHITRGEVLSDSNKSHGFDVADLRHVWVNLNVYQKDLGLISRGQKVAITGPGQLKIDGRISFISPNVNEKTRTATARVVINNRKKVWRPGIFINGRVKTGSKKVAVLIPKTAIFNYKDKNVVFVKNGETFTSKPVITGVFNNKFTEIVSGLTGGEEYASKGGFTIKAEFMKESFGGGHGH